MWHIIMFVFLRISEYLNSIKSRSVQLIDVEWIYCQYYNGTSIWNVCFFLLLLVSKSQLIVISLLKYLSSE